MNPGNSFAVLISILSLLFSLGIGLFSYKLSRHNFLYVIQKLILDKAKDCNEHWDKEGGQVVKHIDKFLVSLKGYKCISEIVITIDLLDTFLSEYDIQKKKPFFLKLFWIQLDSSFRDYFKEVTYVHEMPEKTRVQIQKIKKIFEPYFVQY